MSKTKIAINGLGRIGRMVFRQMFEEDTIEVAAINASYPTETLAHLIKYDSVHGPFERDITVTDKGLRIDNHKIAHVNSRDPRQLPWKEKRSEEHTSELQSRGH